MDLWCLVACADQTPLRKNHYWEMGLLHDEGNFTGVLVFTPVSSTWISKSPSNFIGS
jgi:hypothetical protein